MHVQALIIGGGATGTGLARDLAMRGVQCILVEQTDLNAGASGGNHGLLHSGARYVSNDEVSAAECMEESAILKRIAPHCIENTNGLFVAAPGDDENYIADFPKLCTKCGIAAEELSPREACELEPAISKDIIAAYEVNDASIDPFRLSLENMAHAQSLGANLLKHTKVEGFTIEKNTIRAVHCRNTRTDKIDIIEADQIINAAGAWVGLVSELAGISIPTLYSKGSLLITSSRLTDRVINRLRTPSDGDLLVPGGTVSIFGTTSVRIENLDVIQPDIEEIDALIDQGVRMIPALKDARCIRAYAGVRPLLQLEDAESDRSVSRGFQVFDHNEDGISNFTTVTGGKLTTYRLMAEKTADIVCGKLGVDAPCRTAEEALPSSGEYEWTIPGQSPRLWLKKNDPSDVILCECEMVPKSGIDQIIQLLRDEDEKPSLKAVALRSRLGKGSCQGAFCGLRVTAYLYEREILKGSNGLDELRQFIESRWKGQTSILWDGQLAQAELQEALYCGLFSMEAHEQQR